MTEKAKVNPLIPFAVLGLGCLLLITFNSISHLPEMIRGLFIHVDHPLTYHFPTYDKLLKEVVKDKFVDYQAMKSGPAAKDLQDAVDELAKTGPENLETTEERICYWINSYNLLVLKGITDIYPIKSIHQRNLHRDINMAKFTLAGSAVTPQDVYRLTVLPNLGSHVNAFFLLNGGAQGFPPLLDHAIIPRDLDADAKSSATRFLNDPANVQYHRDRKTFIITPLLKRNEELFDPMGGPHVFVNQFLSANEKVNLQDIRLLTTFMQDFNWWLNDTALAQTKEISPQTADKEPASAPAKTPPVVTKTPEKTAPASSPTASPAASTPNAPPATPPETDPATKEK